MTELEKQVMYNLLVEIKRRAVDASLTGALRKGAPTMAATYNKCLAALKAKGDSTVEQFFLELTTDAGIDDIGIAAALLASYLQPVKRRRGLHPHDIEAFAEDHLDEEDEEDDDEDD